ncbi:MAG TPA: hypothetical protein PKM71_04310 [Candidatus Cloacimonas sp.]|nr:hypothetical protein [Candidatus Cloacimonas sp.]
MKPKIKDYSKKASVKKTVVTDPESEIVDFVSRNHKAATDYRDKFKNNWDRIVEQIRCAHPSEWKEKEDWQSKVFIPQQAKKTETAFAYLDKMLFGQKRFFNIAGVEKNDKEESGYLMDLFDVTLDRGNFYFENDFVMHESCDIGTGFIKTLIDYDSEGKATGLKFVWRSAYKISFDPSCGYKWNPKYVCDEYKKSIQELISELDSGDPLYTKEAIQKVIDAGVEAGQDKGEQDLVTIRGIDGTSQVTISKDWNEVNVVEYWGKAKEKFTDDSGEETIEKYRVVDKIIVVVNNKVKIREDINEYGFIPIRPCRIKPRIYDTYGLGFCENTLDLQELTNSMINLGFDSLKLCSMDIAAVDASKIKDPASIEYKPMAVWLFKGDPKQAMYLTRQGVSALGQIIQGLTLLDQFDQEASGVLRQTQGAQEIGGNSGQTLGEYQAKLGMVDNRFLKVGRFIERDYIEPFLKDMFRILFNPKFFNQVLIDRIIGLKEVEVEILDPATNQPIKIKQQAPKLDFNKLSQAGEMALDFKAVGMTQFSKAIETLEKLKELLLTVVKTPQLMVLSKVEEIFKRVLQAAEIGDYSDLLKSDEEIKNIMNQLYSGQPGQPPAMPGQPGLPVG